MHMQRKVIMGYVDSPTEECGLEDLDSLQYVSMYTLSENSCYKYIILFILSLSQKDWQSGFLALTKA